MQNTAQSSVLLSGFADEAAPRKTLTEQFVAFAALGLNYYTIRFVDAGHGIKNVMELDDAEVDTQSLDFLGAATGLFQLISRFPANFDSEASRLPLSLLAEHNISTEQLQQKSHSDELAQVTQQLAELALDWYAKGLSGLENDLRPPGVKHLQLRWAMEQRRLGVITRDTHGFLEAGKSFGPADAWFAWRFLRRLD